MTSNDVDARAVRLVELEQEREREAESRRREQEEASRLSDARSRIRQHDREIEREQARKEAAAEAVALSAELGRRADQLQRDAEQLSRRIADYAEQRGRLMDARRRAGREAGGSRTESLRYVLPSWFRSLFGGHNSLVGVESELSGRVQAVTPEPRTLAERDPLALTGSRDDVA